MWRQSSEVCSYSYFASSCVHGLNVRVKQMLVWVRNMKAPPRRKYNRKMSPGHMRKIPGYNRLYSTYKLDIFTGYIFKKKNYSYIPRTCREYPSGHILQHMNKGLSHNLFSEHLMKRKFGAIFRNLILQKWTSKTEKHSTSWFSPTNASVAVSAFSALKTDFSVLIFIYVQV